MAEYHHFHMHRHGPRGSHEHRRDLLGSAGQSDRARPRWADQLELRQEEVRLASKPARGSSQRASGARSSGSRIRVIDPHGVVAAHRSEFQMRARHILGSRDTMNLPMPNGYGNGGVISNAYPIA